MAIEIFEEEAAQGFEVVEKKPAAVKPKSPVKSAAPPKPANVAEETPTGPVYADNVLPDEFGLIDEDPQQPAEELPPAPPPKPAPVRVVRAKPTAVPRPAPMAKPVAKARAQAPVAKQPVDLLDLGDDSEKLDIHLEMRTPEAAPPPRLVSPPPRPKPPKPAAEDEHVVDEVEVIADEKPAVRTTKSGVPIVEAASDEEIAEDEARQAARRRQAPPRRR